MRYGCLECGGRRVVDLRRALSATLVSFALLPGAGCFLGHPLTGLDFAAEENQTLQDLALLFFGSPATGASVAILPTDVAGLQLWLRADALTSASDGTAIDNWPDESGFARHAAQSVASMRPLYNSSASNGRPALVFDGDDVLATPAFTLDTFTMFAVFRITSTGVRVIYEHGPDANGSSGHYLSSSELNTTQVNRAQISAKVAGVDWPGSAVDRVTTQSFQRSHATNLLRMDGADLALADAAGPAEREDPIGAPATDSMHLGARVGGSLGIQGAIAELIVYDPLLADSDRDAIECYLARKYGLSFAACN